MTPLRRALEALTPGAVLRNLAAYLGKSAPHLHSEAQGEVCDFRPGQEEENPSLSYGRGTSGPVFHRFGGDGFEGARWRSWNRPDWRRGSGAPATRVGGREG
ncbi:hypothetical protein [Deinococcus aquaticus]|uniref:hypothetical protein n=1 Tax=Deinococcus aquaticus TaxID=328692 RepID=UPI00360C0778